MTTAPVDEIRAVSETSFRDEETMKEYVTRVGEEHDVDAQLVQQARLFVTEHYYSPGTPEDRSGFDSFLEAVDDTTDPETTGEPSTPSDSQTTNQTGDATETQVETGDVTETQAETGDVTETRAETGDATETQVETGGVPETRGSTEVDESETRTGTGASPGAGQAGQSPASAGPDASPGGGPVTAPSDDGVKPGFRTGIRGKEPLKLVLRFLVIVTTAPVVGWMFSRAWVPGNSLYDRGRGLLAELLGTPGPEATKLFVLFAFGVYLGLLVLLTVDIRKRVQAMLLWLGTLLAIVAVASVGWVVPRVELTQLNVLGFLLGFAGGIALEADQLRAIDRTASSFRRPTQSSGAVSEFRYAAGVLFALLLVAVVATLVQLVLADVVQVYDPVVTVVFLAGTFQFVRYESETSYATLGPERSGKSMLVLGLCLTLLQNDEMHPDPNDYLQSSLERASNLDSSRTRWPIPSTEPDALQTASFELIAGYYFPRRLEMTALDYAGQHLTRIAERIDTGSETDDDGVPAQVVDWVGQTDTLLFVLDVERLVYPEEFGDDAVGDGTISWGLEHYTTIAEGVDPDDTVVVATKCDILVDTGRVDPAQSYDSYAGFREAVTEHLAARPDVQELLATVDESTVHPVYFTTERRDGTYVPYLDDDGNLVPVGYGHLVDEMRARQ